MSIDISVIVPFLNEERFIRLCLESLLACDYPEERCEFIFIDNGSTDNGARIVGEYPRATLLTETQGMVYTARNGGLAKARGRVIAFTDADCVVAPHWLRTVHDAILDQGATIVMGGVGFARPRSALLDVTEAYRNDHVQYAVENKIWDHVYGYTNNMALRADVFERLGPFLELPIPGDTEIVHRCLLDDPETPIAYRHDMWVDHLEMTSFGILIRKLFSYGWFEIHLPRRRHKPADSPGIKGLGTYTIRKHRLSFRRRLLLRFGVFASDTTYTAGIWWGRLRRAVRGG